MRNAITLVLLLHAALLIPGKGAAQTFAQAANNPQDPMTQSSPVTQAPLASEEGEAPHTAPVFWITSVEILRSTHAPQLDVVRVRGLVTTEGWESGQLIPLTKGVPSDGILDLALVAEAPTDSTTPGLYPEIEAVFTIESGHPFKGVRVHGAANRVVVNTFPGYAEAVAPPKGCVDCMGKYLVRKGEAAPANRKPETIVREEELPPRLHVIRDSDGIGTLDSDPNRMTLLLNEKGEIVLAAWD